MTQYPAHNDVGGAPEQEGWTREMTRTAFSFGTFLGLYTRTPVLQGHTPVHFKHKMNDSFKKYINKKKDLIETQKG